MSESDPRPAPPRAVPIVADFVVPEREGGYARGKAGHEQILRAAIDILIEEGFTGLTMRRIATRCGLKPGNLSYYFPTKEDLVRALLDAIISSYEVEFEIILSDAGATAEERLERLCNLVLEDILTKKTTRIFPELWALSNHDPFISDRMHELYVRARAPLTVMIGELNPALSEQDREDLSLFISASMESLTIFAGYQKPYADRMPTLERMAVQSFLSLIANWKTGGSR